MSGTQKPQKMLVRKNSFFVVRRHLRDLLSPPSPPPMTTSIRSHHMDLVLSCFVASQWNYRCVYSFVWGIWYYASALYIAVVKVNALEKVKSELLDPVEASKKSPTFAQFAKDLSVPADTRVKALQGISAEAEFLNWQRISWVRRVGLCGWTQDYTDRFYALGWFVI